MCLKDVRWKHDNVIAFSPVKLVFLSWPLSGQDPSSASKVATYHALTVTRVDQYFRSCLERKKQASNSFAAFGFPTRTLEKITHSKSYCNKRQ